MRTLPLSVVSLCSLRSPNLCARKMRCAQRKLCEGRAHFAKSINRRARAKVRPSRNCCFPSHVTGQPPARRRPPSFLTERGRPGWRLGGSASRTAFAALTSNMALAFYQSHPGVVPPQYRPAGPRVGCVSAGGCPFAYMLTLFGTFCHFLCFCRLAGHGLSIFISCATQCRRSLPTQWAATGQHCCVGGCHWVGSFCLRGYPDIKGNLAGVMSPFDVVAQMCVLSDVRLLSPQLSLRCRVEQVVCA